MRQLGPRGLIGVGRPAALRPYANRQSQHFPMPLWRAAQAARAAGARNARILALGHSATAGYGANGGGTNGLDANGAAWGWTRQIADLFSASGAVGNWQSFLGLGGQSATLAAVTAHDNRLTVASPWEPVTTPAYVGLGLGYFRSPSSGAGLLQFTAAQSVRTFQLATARVFSGTQTIDVSIDGGAPQTFDVTTTGHGNELLTLTVDAGSAGLHTVAVRNSAGDAWVSGITGLPAEKCTIITMAAASGTLASSILVNTSWSGYIADFARAAPDLTVIQYEGNSIIQGEPVETMVSAYRSLITEAKRTGDVVLVLDIPLTELQLARVPYDAALHALARELRINLIDMNARWGSVGYGWDHGLYFEGIHPSTAGYADIAAAIYAAIR